MKIEEGYERVGEATLMLVCLLYFLLHAMQQGWNDVNPRHAEH